MNGMFLAFASNFGADQREMQSVVDFVLGQRMPGSGYKCRANRSGVRVASAHSDERHRRFAEYRTRGYSYRAKAVRRAIDDAAAVLLDWNLYQRRSDGEQTRAEFTGFHEPTRLKPAAPAALPTRIARSATPRR